MGPTIDSRIKTLDGGIALLDIDVKIGAYEHNSLDRQCYHVHNCNEIRFETKHKCSFQMMLRNKSSGLGFRFRYGCAWTELDDLQLGINQKMQHVILLSYDEIDFHSNELEDVVRARELLMSIKNRFPMKLTLPSFLRCLLSWKLKINILCMKILKISGTSTCAT